MSRLLRLFLLQKRHLLEMVYPTEEKGGLDHRPEIILGPLSFQIHTIPASSITAHASQCLVIEAFYKPFDQEASYIFPHYLDKRNV